MSLDRVAHARLLYEVISLQKSPADAESALVDGWDMDIAVVVLTARDISEVLTRFTEHSLSAELVADWADFLELRDDVDYDSPSVKELVHELANWEIEGLLSTERARQLLKELSRA